MGPASCLVVWASWSSSLSESQPGSLVSEEAYLHLHQAGIQAQIVRSQSMPGSTVAAVGQRVGQPASLHASGAVVAHAYAPFLALPRIPSSHSFRYPQQ